MGYIGFIGNLVRTATNQTIAGIKTFTSSPVMPTLSAGDNSTKGATTAFVQGEKVGSIIQTQTNNTSTVATGTTTIPFDNTKPQITEGTQFLSYSFTPKQSSGVLKITVSVQVSLSVAGHIIVAVFDGSSDAIAVRDFTASSTNEVQPVTFSFPYSFSSSAAKTFSVRMGGNSASTITFNGSASAGLYGGSINSALIIEEIKV